MKFAPNITITFTHTNIAIAEAWEVACREVLGRAYEPTCTSGLSGRHSEMSGHYYGRALDFRTRDIPPAQRATIKERCQLALGPEFYLEIEDDHVHIQKNKNTF